MPEGVSARISEYIKYIKKLNKALYAVAYGAEAIIVTFEPRVMILHGPRAEAVANNLLQARKIQYATQLTTKGRYAKRAYIAEFYD